MKQLGVTPLKRYTCIAHENYTHVSINISLQTMDFNDQILYLFLQITLPRSP